MNDSPASHPPHVTPEPHHPVLGVTLCVGPEIAVDSWIKEVPAKGACYVMEDGEGSPVLLATTANLRNALLTKLGPPPADQPPTRRIDYAAIVRRVRYRLVTSSFEGNWVYLENARALLPRDYRRLTKHWRAHWVTINLADHTPRFAPSDHPDGPGDTCFGPLPDSRAARRLVETLEDLFDLCRYPAVLSQSPDGVACPYKQMGRCPAPCDGTVTLDEYREPLRAALRFLTGPRQAWMMETTEAMKSAAGERRFEEAARLKRMLQRSEAPQSGADLLAPLREFRYISVQRGARRGVVNVFLVTPGRIDPLGSITPKQGDADTARVLNEAHALLAGLPADPPRDRAALERTALAAWQLFTSSLRRGIFLRAAIADASAIADSIEKVWEKTTRDRDHSGVESLGEGGAEGDVTQP